jgi:hypothetical protein
MIRKEIKGHDRKSKTWARNKMSLKDMVRKAWKGKEPTRRSGNEIEGEDVDRHQARALVQFRTLGLRPM